MTAQTWYRRPEMGMLVSPSDGPTTLTSEDVVSFNIQPLDQSFGSQRDPMRTTLTPPPDANFFVDAMPEPSLALPISEVPPFCLDEPMCEVPTTPEDPCATGGFVEIKPDPELRDACSFVNLGETAPSSTKRKKETKAKESGQQPSALMIKNAQSVKQEPKKVQKRRGQKPRKKSQNSLSEETDADGVAENGLPKDPKRRRVLERNRIAATKCRLRKRDEAVALGNQEREMEEKNRALSKSLSDLKIEIYELKEQLLKHSTCNCSLIQAYISSEAKKSVASMTGVEMGADALPVVEAEPQAAVDFGTAENSPEFHDYSGSSSSSSSPSEKSDDISPKAEDGQVNWLYSIPGYSPQLQGFGDPHGLGITMDPKAAMAASPSLLGSMGSVAGFDNGPFTDLQWPSNGQMDGWEFPSCAV